MFLNKTKAALENLHLISEKIWTESTGFQSRIPFLNRFNKITRIFPPVLFKWLFNLFRRVIKKNLTGKNPHLFLFDLYKLGYFASLKKTNQSRKKK